MHFSCRPVWQGFMVICLALGMAAVSCLGADSATAGKAADDTASTDGKIQITADRLISDSANNQAEFVGNVHAIQGQTRITADSLKIFFSKKSAGDDTGPAQSLEKLVASGNVQIKFDNRLAVARQAVYITAERVLILTGPDATITSGENTISGEKITFYRTDGRFTVEGDGPGKPVKATFLPEEATGLE